MAMATSFSLPHLPFLVPICSSIWPGFLWSPDCFLDIVVGFDISTHRQGQLLFHGHPRLESYLPGILEDITSIRGVSCGAGAEVQVSVAFKVNSDQNFTTKFHIYKKTVFDGLLELTVNGATHLNAQFLQSMWATFNDTSASRGQVSMSQGSPPLLALSFASPHPPPPAITDFVFMSSHSMLSSFSRCYSSFQMALGVKAKQCLKINRTGSEKQVNLKLKMYMMKQGMYRTSLY